MNMSLGTSSGVATNARITLPAELFVGAPRLGAPVSAERYMQLLHVKFGKLQQQDGGYRGEPRALCPAAIESHLSGRETIALCAAYDKKTNFLGLEIDGGFSTILPVAQKLLTRFRIDGATFLTTGSPDGDRGKIVITVSKRVSHDSGCVVIEAIQQELLSSPEWLANQHPDREIRAWPQLKSGGVLRIGGRNAKRTETYHRDQFLDINSNPWSLQGIEPLSPQRFSHLWRSIRAGKPKDKKLAIWCVKALERKWGWPGDGNKGISRRLLAVGREYVAAFGTGDVARAEYIGAMLRVRANSPALDSKSPKTKDGRHPLSDDRLARAWRCAVRRPRAFIPCDLTTASKYNIETYCGMLRFCDDLGLRPNVPFGVTGVRIAPYIGVSPAQAPRRIQAAAQAAIVIIVDRGLPRARGRPGRAAQYRLASHFEARR